MGCDGTGYEFDDDKPSPPTVYSNMYAIEELKRQHQELEAEVGRLTGLLFKFSKLFAEELNI